MRRSFFSSVCRSIFPALAVGAVLLTSCLPDAGGGGGGKPSTSGLGAALGQEHGGSGGVGAGGTANLGRGGGNDALGAGGTAGMGGSAVASGSGAAGTRVTGAGSMGASGTTGSAGRPGVGDAIAPGKVFSTCRFHFGALDSAAKSNSTLLAQIDYFTPGWMGQKDTFDLTSVCTEAKDGAVLGDKVPVIVAYVAAFYAKRHFGRCDCNVSTCGANNDLCHHGAADIADNLSAVINVYKSYAQGFASCYGTNKPIVFEMEPDFYQYTVSQQSAPWTFAQAGQIMGQFVDAVKQSLPNAVFSMDISPWVGTNDKSGNDGSDNGKNWFSYFDLSRFTFISTSGGGTNAATSKIRSDAMTWAGVSQVTGKPILADTGYGVNGASSGHDAAWDSTANINARIGDGVASIIQYNPSSGWSSTITSIRSQLQMPAYCR